VERVRVEDEVEDEPEAEVEEVEEDIQLEGWIVCVWRERRYRWATILSCLSPCYLPFLCDR